ncbi:MAG: DUF3999 family protein [Xanthomonadales bacterium PRO6]|nr:DUF3999 family protein [Xanthomonadales bacterium PRO6]
MTEFVGTRLRGRERSKAVRVRSCLFDGFAGPRLRALAAALALSAPLHAADPPRDPRPDEFVLHLPLAVSGANGVVQYPLPREVYLASRAEGLADLRVYNSAGQWLPYALHHPLRTAQSALREQSATLFPIYRDESAPATGGALELQLRTGPDGALLGVDARPSAQQQARQRLVALILDLRPAARHERLESLAFTPAEAGANYRARVAIERSDDLRLWDGIAQGTVDWIASADASAQLVNDRIEVPPGHGRYLKLRWVDGNPQVFAAVRARWESTTTMADPQLEVVLDAHAGKVDGDFAYATSPAIAARAIGLDLPEPNTVLPVTIGFYRELRQPQPRWQLQPQLTSTFYRLNHDGGERLSSRLHVPPMAASEWVVRPHATGHAAPRLVLRWQPHTLVFTARGQGFVLAVGAAPESVREWRASATQVSAVAPGFSEREIAALETAVAGAPLPPPPPATQPAAAAPPEDADAAARQRRYALWSVLGLGILVLGWMTWRLYEQMVEGRRD